MRYYIQSVVTGAYYVSLPDTGTWTQNIEKATIYSLEYALSRLTSFTITGIVDVKTVRIIKVETKITTIYEHKE